MAEAVRSVIRRSELIGEVGSKLVSYVALGDRWC